jgi:hypothetical protein
MSSSGARELFTRFDTVGGWLEQFGAGETKIAVIVNHIYRASRDRSSSPDWKALDVGGSAALPTGPTTRISVLLPLNFSRSAHSAHMSQVSERRCHPSCPSSSGASRAAAMQSCALFRQAASIIIAATPHNAALCVFHLTCMSARRRGIFHPGHGHHAFRGHFAIGFQPPGYSIECGFRALEVRSRS